MAYAIFVFAKIQKNGAMANGIAKRAMLYKKD